MVNVLLTLWTMTSCSSLSLCFSLSSSSSEVSDAVSWIRRDRCGRVIPASPSPGASPALLSGWPRSKASESRNGMEGELSSAGLRNGLKYKERSSEDMSGMDKHRINYRGVE